MKGLDQTQFSLFASIIKHSFLDLPFNYKGRTFHPKPIIVSPYDFVRKIQRPRTDYEKLLSELNFDFKSTARSEMYRKERGWIAQRIKQGHNQEDRN